MPDLSGIFSVNSLKNVSNSVKYRINPEFQPNEFSEPFYVQRSLKLGVRVCSDDVTREKIRAICLNFLFQHREKQR